MYVLRSYLILGILDRFCHRLNTLCLRQIMRNWEVWKTNIEKSNNHRIFQQLDFHTQQTIQAFKTLTLVLALTMTTFRSTPRNDRWLLNPVKLWNSYLTITWKSLVFLTHIKCRTNLQWWSFPSSTWETWFYSSLGVPIPTLIGPFQQCACNVFHYDKFGDHLLGYRHANLNQWFHRLATGSFIDWVWCSVPWVTKLRSIR